MAIAEVGDEPIYSTTGEVTECLSASGGGRGAARAGRDAAAFAEIDDIVDWVVAGRQEGDVVLVMSNGAFGGIWEKLLARAGGAHVGLSSLGLRGRSAESRPPGGPRGPRGLDPRLLRRLARSPRPDPHPPGSVIDPGCAAPASRADRRSRRRAHGPRTRHRHGRSRPRCVRALTITSSISVWTPPSPTSPSWARYSKMSSAPLMSPCQGLCALHVPHDVVRPERAKGLAVAVFDGLKALMNQERVGMVDHKPLLNEPGARSS